MNYLNSCGLVLQRATDSIRALSFDRFWASVALLLIIFAYAYQAILPAFNADDIIQIQEISNDSYTFLGSGRWGYFLIFNKLLDANPGGLFATLLGCVALFYSAVQAASIIGLREGASKLFFVLISSISLYYGLLFDFDSTRIAYPLAVFLAITGLNFVIRKRYVGGLVLMSLAPAFYQPASQVAGTVLVMAALFCTLTEQPASAIKKFVVGGVMIVASLLVYLFITKISYYFLGFSLTARMSINPLEIFENWSGMVGILKNSTVPFLFDHATYYFGYRLIVPIGVSFVVFVCAVLVSCFLQRNVLGFLFVAFLFSISLFTPFALALVAGESAFPPRSLIALATLYACWLAIPLEIFLRGHNGGTLRHGLIVGVVLLGIMITAENFSQINKKAFDEYLVSQQDILATNRIIYRIDDVISDAQEINPHGPIQIAVIYNVPLPAGVRGEVGSARWLPWSREWIFRLVDQRFVVASEVMFEKAKAYAADRPNWPAKDSVFVRDQMVIVVLNK